MLTPKKAAAGRRAAPRRCGGRPDPPGRRRRHRRRADEERRTRLRRRGPRAGRQRTARLRAPRAPTSTASSCSSACPYGTLYAAGQRGFGGGGKDSGRPRAERSVVDAEHTVVRLGSIQPRQPIIAARGDHRRACRLPASGEAEHRARLRSAMSYVDAGAVEKTRTSTAFRPQRPQRCASTSSATTARHEMSRLWDAAGTGKARPLAKAPRAAQWRIGAVANSLHIGTIPNSAFTIRARPR